MSARIPSAVPSPDPPLTWCAGLVALTHNRVLEWILLAVMLLQLLVLGLQDPAQLQRGQQQALPSILAYLSIFSTLFPALQGSGDLVASAMAAIACVAALVIQLAVAYLLAPAERSSNLTKSSSSPFLFEYVLNGHLATGRDVDEDSTLDTRYVTPLWWYCTYGHIHTHTHPHLYTHMQTHTHSLTHSITLSFKLTHTRILQHRSTRTLQQTHTHKQ